MESILTSVKKLLGIAEEYTQFDSDIVIHINTAFTILQQLGVGPPEGFSITDKYAVWTDFLPAEDLRYESVKTYMYMKVRIMFDPPQSSSVMEAMKNTINELEWRLNFTAELSSSDN